jgi:hypothetical protein
MDPRHHLVPTRVQLAVVVEEAIMVLAEEVVDQEVAVQERSQILRLAPEEVATHLQIQDGLQEDLPVELELITVVLEEEELALSAHLQPQVLSVPVETV